MEHNAQAVAPAALYLPAPQIVHAEEAAASWKVPTEQLVHAAAPVALYRPTAQSPQAEAPVPDAYLPAGHWPHTVALARANLAGLQLVQ